PLVSRYDAVVHGSISVASGFESEGRPRRCLRSVYRKSALSPPLEVAPAAMRATVERHAGHMRHLLVRLFRRAGMLKLPHRPDLDAAQAQRRDLRGQLDGLVEVPRLDQDEAAELLLGLREGPVGRRYAAVPQPERRGGLHGFERVGGDKVTVL